MSEERPEYKPNWYAEKMEYTRTDDWTKDADTAYLNDIRARGYMEVGRRRIVRDMVTVKRETWESIRNVLQNALAELETLNGCEVNDGPSEGQSLVEAQKEIHNLKSENERLREKVYRLEAENANYATVNNSLNKDILSGVDMIHFVDLQAENEQLQQQLAGSEAAAGAMRQILQRLSDKMAPGPVRPYSSKIEVTANEKYDMRQALAPDSGKAATERSERMRSLLQEALVEYATHQRGCTRYKRYGEEYPCDCGYLDWHKAARELIEKEASDGI